MGKDRVSLLPDDVKSVSEVVDDGEMLRLHVKDSKPVPIPFVHGRLNEGASVSRELMMLKPEVHKQTTAGDLTILTGALLLDATALGLKALTQ